MNLARRGFQRAAFWRRYFDALNRGDFAAVQATYNEWYAFVNDSIKRGHANLYAERCLRRFGGNTINTLAASVGAAG